MKMKKLAIAISCFAIPFLTYAADLKIVNESKFDLSFKINNICADSFGNISAHTIKIVPEASFNFACKYNPQHCLSDVYAGTACQGDNFAQIEFDTMTGVISILGKTSEPVSISGNEFNLSFNSPIK